MCKLELPGLNGSFPHSSWLPRFTIVPVAAVAAVAALSSLELDVLKHDAVYGVRVHQHHAD